MEKIQELRKAQRDLAGAQALVADAGDDAEMKALAEAEAYALEKSVPALEREVQLALLPKDEADAKNAILEVRAGTGGEEAGLFAAELFRMYQRYAESRRWKFEILTISETGIGAYKEATASVVGIGVFARLKFESGRAPGAARAGDGIRRAHSYLGGNGGDYAGSRGGGRAYRRQGFEDRYATCLGRGVGSM